MDRNNAWYSIPDNGWVWDERNWTLVTSPDPNWPGPTAYIVQEGPTWWCGAQTHGRWISSKNFGWLDVLPAGVYVFQVTFDLTGFDPTSARVAGVWSVDDTGVMTINGNFVANQTNTGRDNWQNVPPLNFEITSGFVQGTNVLQVAVTNIQDSPWGNPKPDGLLVAINQASAHAYETGDD